MTLFGEVGVWRIFFVLISCRTRRPGSCYLSDADTWSDVHGGVSVPGFMQALWFRPGRCHFDREQRQPCWCQREARHSKASPPSSRSTAISLLMASASLCLCHCPGLYLWVINTHALNRQNLCNHVVHWLNLIIPLTTLTVNWSEWVQSRIVIIRTLSREEKGTWWIEAYFSF